MHVGTLPSGPGSSDEGLVTAKPTQFFLRGGLCLMGTHFFEVETIQLNRRRLWRLRAVAVKATRLRSQLCVLEAGYLSLL